MGSWFIPEQVKPFILRLARNLLGDCDDAQKSALAGRRKRQSR
jgi:hypothetical protein